jgi:8-oxo-dGTP pyrophosphatase MutT (NUDIX family)
MINGAFTVISYDGKYLFIKRKDKGKWDLPGGGFDVNEIDYKGVTVREIKEETGIVTTREDLKICAILGQRLPERVRSEFRVDFGLIFLHTLFLHEKPDIVLSEEHTDFNFFSYTEILESYKDFSSGPLWEFFTYLKYQETGILQEGILKDRSVWLGQAYV